MTVLTHKGFQGSVKFEGDRLLVQILHIDDFVSTECDSAAEVASAFKDLVNDYLETCKAVDKEPCKPFKGSFNIRISPELHRRAAMAAAVEDESLNSWIGQAIYRRLNDDTKRTQVIAAELFSKSMSGLEIGVASYYKAGGSSALKISDRRSDRVEMLRVQAEAQDIVFPPFKNREAH